MSRGVEGAAWCSDGDGWQPVLEEHVESDEPRSYVMWMVSELRCGHQAVRQLTLDEIRREHNR